jgi:glycosyltransferase involved in cell wall biosynthesis
MPPAILKKLEYRMSTTDSSLPKVSYIMPVFNRANVVGRAIEGVIEERQRNYPNIELVVMDGGSTDGTIEIIKSYGGEIQIFRSEKDGGAADAFNKGVELANGEIIRYVAGDDKILVGHTRRMVDYLQSNPEVELLGARANCLRMDGMGNATASRTHASLQDGWMTPDEVLTWDRSGIFAYIETWFFRRSIFEKVGHLDTRYRICPDVDFAFRVVNAGVSFFVLQDIIMDKIFYTDGSNLVANHAKSFAELRDIVSRHGSLQQRIRFFYNFPAPLHERIFFGAWLWVIKKTKLMIPQAYKKIQQVLGK